MADLISGLSQLSHSVPPIAWLAVGGLAISILGRSPTVIGYFGELKLRLTIAFRLDRTRYHTFHGVVLPTRDGTTQIDHVVISRYGIFVIETKNMKGWILGTEGHRRWTQVLSRRRHAFMNPLRQNYRHVKALQEAIEAPANAFHSVVVFVGRSRFKTAMPSNVVRLRGLVEYIRSKTWLWLDEDQVGHAVRQLSQRRLRGPFMGWIHIRNLRRNRVHPTCPRCGSTMVLRTARKGANVNGQFWGCSSYPSCTATRELT